MTKLVFFRSDGIFYGFEEQGHTGYGQEGDDIICAALSAMTMLIINTVVTFLYAYGIHRGKEKLCTRATTFLEELKPENNHIIRMWNECGLKVAHAGDSQALIQLKKEYCDKKKCLYCRIGYEYLKRK